MAKYIFVTGGVLSSLGKGIASASIGALLEAKGLKVTLMKMDPYLNIDPGTMSPFQHGEVFVTDDGAETDLDLGHYERFTSSQTSKNHTWTAGRVYNNVLSKERRGDYLGKTVQVIPHVTNEIKTAMHTVANGVDIVIVEIGGTVGDIESQPFLEAVRQFRVDVGSDEKGKPNALNIHLTYVPYIKTAGELKSKPTQHSVRELRALGLHPDILLCRGDMALPDDLREKIALFCSVTKDAVFSAQDVSSIYEVPINFHQQNIHQKITELLGLSSREPDLTPWEDLIHRIHNPNKKVVITIVGKYVEFKESYKSLTESLYHAGYSHAADVQLRWVEAEHLEKDGSDTLLIGSDGILVPGGFGVRGTRGMIRAIQYAREHKIPFFGICLGLQMACLEFAQNVAGLPKADSTEFNENAEDKVIFKLRDLVDVEELGGTMRLGAYPCTLTYGSKAYQAYESSEISERHRHRYEFNHAYRPQLEAAGLCFSGISPDGVFIEMIELKDHPHFIACQFHPEFKSKPLRPHPLFVSFIKASLPSGN